MNILKGTVLSGWFLSMVSHPKTFPFLIGVFSCLFACNLWAGETTGVPDVLKPWIPWVLKGAENLQCPFIAVKEQPVVQNEPALQRVCAWPGQLALVVKDKGADFKQKWQVFAKSPVFLPSAENAWPEGVLDNGQPVPVLELNHKPAVWLSAGEHSIEGQLSWSHKPQFLTLPEQTGLVSLTHDGVLIPYPERTETELWLQQKQDSTKEGRVPESLHIQVYRVVTDGIPLTLTTRVKLDVSGDPREAVLGKVLLSNFIPTELTSALPGRIEPDGRLRVQLRPGSWELTLTARQKKPALQIAYERTEGAWSQGEIWSYQANNRLRATEVKAGELVDPKQAGVPTEWHNLPSFRMSTHDKLTLEEKARGMGEALAQLTLNRDLWLDFDGSGFTVKDKMTGQLESPKRLDIKLPYELKQVSIQGEQLSVTRGQHADESGVEARKLNLTLDSIARIKGGSGQKLPVTGWQQDFKQVQTNLHLPPGYHLLMASNVDKAEGAWVDRWTLLDCFLVLFTALVIGKLLNRTWGILSVVMLVIFFHETGMHINPWLNLLAAMALSVYLPAGRFKKIMTGYGVLSFVAVLIMVLPFAAEQVRLSLYPQLEQFTPLDFAPRPAEDQMPLMLGEGAGSAKETSASREAFAAMALPAAPALKKTTEFRGVNAERVQNSEYLPAWRWNEYSLRWSGAVSAAETMRIIVMPRWLIAFLRLLGVVFLLGVVGRLAFGIFKEIPSMRFGTSSVATLLCLVLWGTQGIQQPVFAGEIPTTEMLTELKKRLAEPPSCAPACVSISTASVQIERDTLTVRLTVESAAQTAVAIPGGLKEWFPQQAYFEKLSCPLPPCGGGLEPAPENFLIRGRGVGERLPVAFLNQHLWVAIDKGVHALVLKGSVPPGPSFQVPFPVKPLTITVTAPDWTTNGIREDKLLSGSLSFTRLAAPPSPGLKNFPGQALTLPHKGGGDKTEFPHKGGGDLSRLFQPIPSFVQVERAVSFGTSFRIYTKVKRQVNNQEAIHLQIPLVPGESVVNPADFKVEGNKAIVSLSADQQQLNWDSVLKETPTLTLTAAKTEDWTENWRFQASPEWHLDFKGIPPVRSDAPWVSLENEYQFLPWPGETLTLNLFRPEALPGPTLTIEKSEFESTPGHHATDLMLRLTYRSTLGGHHRLDWPKELVLQEVKLDGTSTPLKANEGAFLLPVLPGTHQVEFHWQQPVGVSWHMVFPAIHLNAPANNANSLLKMPDSRWIWVTGGPRLGPAVLYWGELLLFLVIAIALARTKQTPLKIQDWILLGLGVSMTAWSAFLGMAIWLFALAYRGRTSASRAWVFNAGQILLCLFTLMVLSHLAAVIPQSLLGSPDMHIVGNGSTHAELHWFDDYQAKELPQPWVVSLPLWTYRVMMLAWALWFAFALLRWLKWGWTCMNQGGIWRRSPKQKLEVHS